MRSPRRILHFEPDRTYSERVRETLQADGFDCRLTVDTRPEFDASLEQGDFDLILADNAIDRSLESLVLHGCGRTRAPPTLPLIPHGVARRTDAPAPATCKF